TRSRSCAASSTPWPPPESGAKLRDLRDEVLRVLADAEEERRLALVEPVEPDEEEPWDWRHASLVHRPALGVDLDALDPGVVGPEPVRPHDGRDALAT